MDEQEDTKKSGQSIVSQVNAEREKSKREAVKAQYKALVIELDKSKEVTMGIAQKAQEILASVGEKVDLKTIIGGV